MADPPHKPRSPLRCGMVALGTSDWRAHRRYGHHSRPACPRPAH